MATELFTDCANQTSSNLTLILTIVGTAAASLGVLISLIVILFNRLDKDINRLDNEIKTLTNKVDAEAKVTTARVDKQNARIDYQITTSNKRFDEMQRTILKIVRGPKHKPKTDP